MADGASKVPAKAEEKAPKAAGPLPAVRPLESLRRDIDRLFASLDRDYWRFPFGRSIFDLEPLWRRELSWPTGPAIDIAENNKAYEITAELPGMDEKNIEVKVANGNLTIRGEKQDRRKKRTIT